MQLAIDKGENKLEKKFDRKKFFTTSTKILLFTMLSSIFPVKIFSSKKTINKKLNISIHPSAVKRVNKV